MQIDAQMFFEHADDALSFVCPQDAVIDKHAGQLTADGLVQQNGRDGRIHPAG